MFDISVLETFIVHSCEKNYILMYVGNSLSIALMNVKMEMARGKDADGIPLVSTALDFHLLMSLSLQMHYP